MPSSLVDLDDLLENRLHQQRRDAERRLVEHQALRLAHQRAADREHLLLAAGERAGGLLLALLQARENAEDVVEILRRCLRCRSAGRRPCGDFPCTVRLAKTMRPSGTCARPRATILCGGTFGDVLRRRKVIAAGRALSRGRRWRAASSILPAPFAPIERDDAALLAP